MKKSANTHIEIKGANVHNLKNVDLVFPKNQMVVFTGVSGSGKSSLCIHTLFAEGQRRYVESLSSYARQFLDRMNKPDVAYIKGLTPAIAIDQNTSGKTTRATVGSLTEIYDYLRVLYARLGKTYSPKTGELVKKDEIKDVVEFIFTQNEADKILISFPKHIKNNWKEELHLLNQKGFSRVSVGGTVIKITSLLEDDSTMKNVDINIVVDRIVLKKEEKIRGRLADSIQTCFQESEGECIIEVMDGESTSFNNRFERDGMVFTEPSVQFFNFNSPVGACTQCEGFGTMIGIDEDLVIPDKRKSIYDDAVVAWKGDKMQEWKRELVYSADMFDFPIHKPFNELTKAQQKLVWTGNKHFAGINKFFKEVESQSYKIQYRVMLSRYRGKTKCSQCDGSRLRKEVQYVKIDEKSIGELLMLPIEKLYAFFEEITLDKFQKVASKRILFEIKTRLKTMLEVGLGYLSLNRLAGTLSGGESQRIKLTRSLGSNLTSSMYILDEPSIGLHSRDTQRLISVLKRLRDLGNTVVVVEHDEDMINAADFLVDMGPKAGINGGEVVFAGDAVDIVNAKNSLTAEYITGKKEIVLPKTRRKSINKIQLIGASQFNLKNVSIDIPLNCMTVVIGVSGSGKTTLIKNIFYPALKKELNGFGEKAGEHRDIKGDIKSIKSVEMVDQNPLGKSSRSNAVTYVKVYDNIRDLFSKQKLAKVRGLKPKHFSFNVEAGRCETCKGEGTITVEMQFLADVHLVCETCKGQRFKEEVLDIKYKKHNIFDVLGLSIEEAILFFEGEKDIVKKLQPLEDVGLGYVKLGQSSSTLSGGESQRLKLASFLIKSRNPDPILFIFDEPTTGLHFDDVNKLLKAFDALIKIGHSVVVIEHNPDVIKYADWLIELGPEGGEKGGSLVYQGAPEGILKVKNSPTAPFLRDKLK
ncbi:MAG: excinuclease ABC subunit UvrA [Chitinophagales bacterium]